MKTKTNRHVFWFVVTSFILAGASIGWAAIPQNTFRNNAGGTMPTFNATVEYYRGGLNYTAWLLAKADIATTKFDQSLNTTDAVTFVTVNTGQGNNELYDMDQDVLTTSNVTYGEANVTSKFYLGTQLTVNATIDVNFEWSGISAVLRAGEPIDQGDLLYIGISGNLRETDADSNVSVPCVALALEDIANGQLGLVLMQGWVYNSAWSLAEGDYVFVSTATGELTPTPPAGAGDQIQVIGIGLTEDLLWFNPDYTVLEII